jgi:hypothetical protein
MHTSYVHNANLLLVPCVCLPKCLLLLKTILTEERAEILPTSAPTLAVEHTAGYSTLQIICTSNQLCICTTVLPSSSRVITRAEQRTSTNRGGG